VRILPLFTLLLVVASGVRSAPEIWRLDNLKQIGGYAVVREGAPRVTERGGVAGIEFDGLKDGLFVAKIPFAGTKAYTIEICFRPSEGGPKEQRFFHAEDVAGSRAMIETRLTGTGGWWLDTFLTNSRTGGGVTLVDATRLHQTEQWFWAALRYDGKTMAHFVNGKKEIERDAKFEPFGDGQISLGVRQNKVFWFKGAIREVRFHREAVADAQLQRVK
jgi:hypothetical protein